MVCVFGPLKARSACAHMKVRYKSKARRFEIDVPLDTSIDQYNEHADEKTRITSVTLQSSEVIANTAYMVS